MLGIWERAESEGSLLPSVIPIVLYKGKERWTVRTLSQSFPGIPDRLRPFLPEFGFLLVDLARTSRENLRESYGNRSVLMAMELMKAIFSPAEVAALMERLTPEDGPLDTELAMRFLRVVLRYIFNRSDYGVQEALTLKLHPATREVTMTMEEQILKIGEERGIEKGIEKGLEQGLEQGLRQTSLENARKMLDRGYDWDAITDITGIKPEDLATA